MWYLNLIFNTLFEVLMFPFRWVDPLLPLIFFSVLTGILMLIIFRYTSNQEAIKRTKDKIKGYLLEIRIFKDNLGIFFSAQKKLFRHNLTYMKYAVKPMLFMIIPVVIILIQLEGWFGHEPLQVGETAIVSLNLSDGAGDLSDVSLLTNGGISIETPPLRIPSEREVDWRIRAEEPGRHGLLFKLGTGGIQKEVVVANGTLYRVTPVTGSGFWDSLLYPGEKPISDYSAVKRIEIDYSSRSIDVFGWNIHWLIIFFFLSVVFGYAMKGLFNVEV